MSRTIRRALVGWLLMIGRVSSRRAARIVGDPYVGDFRARQIGAVVGSVIILAIAYWLIEWIGAKDSTTLWTVGLIWIALTLALDSS